MNNTQQTRTKAAKLTKLADALESIRQILDQLDSEDVPSAIVRAKKIANSGFELEEYIRLVSVALLEPDMLRDAIEDVFETS